MRRRAQHGDERRAVAYLRVSTDEQHLGPEAQRAAITRWALAHDVTVVAWHEDRLSGATPVESRDGLLAALQDVRAHRAGVLVAAKRDRIARDVVVAATVERIAQDAGARVLTADGVSTENTPEGALMRTLLDAFAAYERAVIRARTRSALTVKRTRGERVSGRAPLGHRFDAGRVVPDAEEQLLLERVRSMRGRGLSLRRIVEVLNAERVTIRGGRVHETTLSRALRRPEHRAIA